VLKKHHKKNVKAPSGEIYQYNLGADENYQAYAYYYSGDTKKFSSLMAWLLIQAIGL
jgi:hypothetical protein